MFNGQKRHDAIFKKLAFETYISFIFKLLILLNFRIAANN